MGCGDVEGANNGDAGAGQDSDRVANDIHKMQSFLNAMMREDGEEAIAVSAGGGGPFDIDGDNGDDDHSESSEESTVEGDDFEENTSLSMHAEAKSKPGGHQYGSRYAEDKHGMSESRLDRSLPDDSRLNSANIASMHASDPSFHIRKKGGQRPSAKVPSKSMDPPDADDDTDTEEEADLELVNDHSSKDEGVSPSVLPMRTMSNPPIPQQTNMAETCHRSGAKVYAADNPVRIGGMVFHPSTFTCKATGTKLTLKTCVIATDPATGDKDVYLKGKAPWIKPNQVDDVITQRVAKVPDSNMRTGDRMFNVAGKGENRGTTGEDLGSAYGAGAVVVDTQLNAPKPPTTVDNVNQIEKMHNGAAYTNAEGDAPAAAE